MATIEPPLPTLLPAFMAEWSFINTTVAPPSTGQIRLNNVTQTSATLMWVHKITANGNDATAMLTAVKKGEELRIQDKDDSSKWQTYTVANNPTPATNHVEYPITWVRGGQAVPNQRIILEALPAGSQRVAIDPLPALKVTADYVDAQGQMVINDYAYPFEGRHYTNPGLTKRQFYAAAALQGFISGQTSAANLVGRLAPFAFQVADSMISYEKAEAAGYTFPLVGSDRNAPVGTPSPSSIAGRPAGRAAGKAAKPPPQPSANTIWPRKIIS